MAPGVLGCGPTTHLVPSVGMDQVIRVLTGRDPRPDSEDTAGSKDGKAEPVANGANGEDRAESPGSPDSVPDDRQVREGPM